MRLAFASAAILILTSACNPSTAPVTSADPLAPFAAAVSPTHPVGIIDVTVTLSGRPYGIAISKSGSIVLTTQIGLASVARANLPNRTFGSFIPVGVAPPHVAINDAESRHRGRIRSGTEPRREKNLRRQRTLGPDHCHRPPRKVRRYRADGTSRNVAFNARGTTAVVTSKIGFVTVIR